MTPKFFSGVSTCKSFLKKILVSRTSSGWKLAGRGGEKSSQKSKFLTKIADLTTFSASSRDGSGAIEKSMKFYARKKFLASFGLLVVSWGTIFENFRKFRSEKVEVCGEAGARPVLVLSKF